MSTVKVTHGQSNKYAIQGKRAKDVLSKDEQDLYELCSLSGVDISPAVFRIIFDLLKMNVSPVAIVQMLKSMVHRSNKTPSSQSAFGSNSTTDASRISGSSGISTNTSRSMDTARSQSGRTAVKTSRTKPISKTSQRT
ncbi:uncharacterized protein [Asterias amurensis]|uniref:uncharacterized protein n=1 Tax=Asterias amurensis TaxID=7602 RepID=UPI003AB46E76